MCLLVRLLLAVSLASGCSEGPSRDLLLPGLGPVSAEAPADDSTWVLRYVSEYGTGDGPVAFGFPIAATTLSDGSLTVADLFECSVSIIARPAGQLQGRIGGCGDGPGEFRQIRAITSVADSLVVYDQGTNSIVVLDLMGREVRRIRIHSLETSVTTISHLEILDDSTFIVATEEAFDAAVLEMDRRTGEFGRRLWEAPTIARRPGPSGFIRRLAACVEASGESPVVVGMNEWVLEGVGLDAASGEERFHFLTWPLVPPRTNSNGTWVPGLTSADVRCGSSGALFRVTTPGPPPELVGNVTVWRAGEVILEARSYDGELLMRKTLRDSSSLARGSLGAFRGDTVFLLAQNIRPWPVVAEYVLKRRK